MNSNVIPLSSPSAGTRAAPRWHFVEYLFWAIPVTAYFLFPDNLVLLSQIAIMGLFALSLDLILGYAGIVSLGHAAFFGVGAYTAGLLASRGLGDPLLGLLAAVAVTATLGLLTSFFVLRGKDLTRLMVTMGLGMMLYETANKMTGLTGGVDGLQGIVMQPLLRRFAFDMFGTTGYVYSIATLFILFVAARILVHSPFGTSLKGIRGNATRMPALGVNVNRRLCAVYVVGAVYAGIAGALLAQTTQYVTIDVLSFARSADVLLVLILGGIGTLYGPLVGAVIFTIAHHYLSEIDPQYWQFWLGVILLVMVLFARGGLIGLLQRLQARAQGRKTP